MKARTRRIARGEEKPAPDDPKVWFTSTRSFAKLLSAGNRKPFKAPAAETGASSMIWKWRKQDVKTRSCGERQC
ncbi:hypothetical protein [Caulobacter sp. S45]|uniref:hypothetical protein n=1 Tax=Caulobacter sp. S45 TaxID=1641861 RepID=UPI0020C5F1C2|nr:hypothetical protein [Caulobacter sp. S45]